MDIRSSLTSMRAWTAAAMLLGMVLPAAAWSEVVIKLGTIAPEGSVWHDALLRLRQQWRDLTNGEVELRIYAGGVLGGETEMVRKMQRRGLDAIAISGAGLPWVDSSIDCLNVPMLFDSYEELDYVRTSVADDFQKRLQAKNVKVLNWAEAGWVYFFAKQPVKMPDDLRKLRLWIAAGHPETESLFKYFRFQVVPLAETDMLTALQTGLIEAIDVPPLFALLDRSYQAAPYMTDLKWAPLNAATIVHIQAWEQVPAEFRTPLVEAAHQIGKALRDEIRRLGDEAIREMQARGLQIVELDKTTVDVWRNGVKEAYSKLQCAREHPQLFEKVLRLHKEFRSRGSG